MNICYICHMASTLSKIYIHLIFAVKGRYSLIPLQWLPTVHAYMAATIRSLGHECVVVGGTENHVHILIEYNINKLLPDMIRDLKIATTKFINLKRFVVGRFQWQRGYAVLSYSKSAIPQLKEYIGYQFEHHKGVSLDEEVRKFLDRYEIEYDGQYLFED